MQDAHRTGYSGSGPGDITPDGCAVELYRRLPVDNEPRIVASAVPPPATLLELGCGAGRVTGPLSRLGYEVTAVDESPAMLESVTGARTVCSRIERLELRETFDVVMLASFTRARRRPRGTPGPAGDLPAARGTGRGRADPA